MTTTATVATEDLVVHGVAVQRITVDCPHGTTIGDLLVGKFGAPGRDEIVKVLAARHEDEERCGCALPLLGDGATA